MKTWQTTCTASHAIDMNVLIVEDEMLIAETIKLYLKEREYHVVDIAISYEEAIIALQKHSIDVALLDVRLYGEKSGIDIAKYMQEHSNIPYIYLTSQYDKRIIEKAKKTNPKGYITKPISKETLWATIEIAVENQLSENSEKEENLISFNDAGKTIILNENEILFVSADHVYANVITNNRKYTFRSSLNQINALLNQNTFLQCHRSYIVNLRKVNSFSKDKIYIGENAIPVSRSRKKTVAELLNNVI